MIPSSMELDWLKRWNLYAPKSIALQSGETSRSCTYEDLYGQSVVLAHELMSRFSIQAGDRVACLAQNELEYVSLFFAIQRLGAILIPINFRFTGHEIKHVLNDSGAKLLIAQKAFWPVVEPLASQRLEIWAFEDMVGSIESAPLVSMDFKVRPQDPCMILYTSGTTGFPKGAMISPSMMFWNSINTGLRLNLTQKDVVLTFLPLFHTGGWNVLTTPCLHRGAKVILLKKFDPDLVLQLIERERVSLLFGVPTTLDFLNSSANLHHKLELASLCHCRW